MYIILGGTGHVGSAMATALLDQGEPVTVVTRSADKADVWKQRGAEVAVADVYDADALRAVFQTGTRLFILNPLAAPSTDTDTEERKTIAAILHALDGSGLQKIVALSTYGARPDERTGDLSTLYALEEGLNAQPIPATIMRAAYFMSNWDGLVEQVRAEGKFVTFFPPDFTIPMVAPQDLGAAAARFLAEPIEQTGLRFVEGPESYTAADVGAILGDLVGRTVTVETTPRESWLDVFKGMGFSDSAADAYARMTAVTLDEPDSGPNDPLRGPTTLRDYLSNLVASDTKA